jgi:peptide/nickel transport system substrate-binding protein
MKILFVLTAACLLLACAPTSAPPSETTPGEKQPGGIFVKAPQPILEGLYWYDRVYGGGSGQRSVLTDMTETLLSYVYTSPDKDYRTQIGPNLAESWKQVDPRTYEFALRQGVKFHDGEEMTAKDVVFSYERMKEGASAQSGVAKEVEKIEAAGPYIVRFTIRQVSPDFVELIGTDNATSFRVLPALISERAGNATGDALKKLYEATPIGTGPFKFRSFTYNQVADLERFDGYWGGRPYLDGIRSVQRLERAAQTAAFVSGKVDFLSLTDRVQFDSIKQTVPDTKKVTYVLSNGVGLEFNINKKPFDDVRVRRAMHLGVDRDAMVQTVTFGEGTFLAPILTPEQTLGGMGLSQEDLRKMPGWRQPKEQDLTEAKRLLAEAGYPNGFKLNLKFQKGSNNPSVQTEPVAGLLQQNLGIEVTVQAMEDAAYLSQIQKERDFEAVVSVQAAGVGDALSVNPPNKWHTRGGLNYNGYNDREMDQVMDALRVETDAKKRNDLLIQAQKIVLDKAYYAPLIALSQYNAVQAWVNDYYPSYSANTAPRNMQATWMDMARLPVDRRSW